MEGGFAYDEVFLGRLMITILLWLFLQLCTSSSFNEYLYFVVEISHLLIEKFSANQLNDWFSERLVRIYNQIRFIFNSWLN